MSKAGDKILKAMQEALMLARGKPVPGTKVTSWDKNGKKTTKEY